MYPEYNIFNIFMNLKQKVTVSRIMTKLTTLAAKFFFKIILCLSRASSFKARGTARGTAWGTACLVPYAPNTTDETIFNIGRVSSYLINGKMMNKKSYEIVKNEI